ncbi:MAG TPA: VIT and VWA domain-containing protein [Longimicrobiaceae bacterium]|nr:VIT and VWA domain-containing protein [Longimicrobiaceae bacterium]
MRARTLLPALLAAALAALADTPAAAQGIIVPDRCRPDCRRPDELPRALPVESVSVDTRIEGQVATTRVTQVFRNETGMTLEGTYFFPIPEGASISEFAIWDGDRRLAGEVRSREEARRIYDSIVRRRRDPGLLEYAGENLFQASIFPILPRDTKKLELVYTQVLRAESGTVGYRYPLGIGRNAAPVERVSGRVEVRTDRGVRGVYSPTHDIDVRRRDGDRRTTVSFETDGRRARRDFQLFYNLSQEEVGLSLFTYREPGRDGYFLLLLSPRSDVAGRAYAARDVVYVLDTSGSMSEEGKIDKAKRALVFGLRGLGPDDRFNIVAFSGDTRLFETGLIRADAAGKARGVEFVEGLRAAGGTNINDALLAGLQQFGSGGDRPRLLVFLTDGLPTVGVTDPERIVENARRERRDGIRLFTFGVGYDVNTRLLDRVAAENGGTAEYVEPREDLEVRVSSFFDKVNHPVLTDLRLDMGEVRTDLVYPRVLPDLFRGTQVALVGRYRNDRELRDVTVRLSGRASPRREVLSYSGLRFPLRDTRHDFLPRLWATRRVGWLMEQIRTHGENRELRDEVVELGTRYGIVTPYTSFLALEPGAEQNLGERDASIRARDLSGRGSVGGRRQSGGVPAPMAPPPLAAPTAVTGAEAVQASKAARAQQEAVSLEGLTVSGASVQTVGTKTFYLRDGVWTDAELDGAGRLPETRLEFGSAAYFDLLAREPELARYFAVGERVVVVFGGRIYRVEAAKP